MCSSTILQGREEMTKDIFKNCNDAQISSLRLYGEARGGGKINVAGS